MAEPTQTIQPYAQGPSPGSVQAPVPGTATRRIVCAIVLVACATILGVAVGLAPSEEGIGTHQQLGLPPCGMIIRFDMPCATCGMTTAFSHGVRGQLITAFKVQPAGALVCISAAMTCIICLYGLWTGINLMPLLGMIFRPRNIVAFGVIIAASWVYKIALHHGVV